MAVDISSTNRDEPMSRIEKTKSYRIKILHSIFKRHKAQNNKLESDHVRIETEDKKTVELYDDELIIGTKTVCFSEIHDLYWIGKHKPQFRSSEETGKYKIENYGTVELRFGLFKRKLVLSHLGQSVFPLMHYIKWAREHGDIEKSGDKPRR